MFRSSYGTRLIPKILKILMCVYNIVELRCLKSKYPLFFRHTAVFGTQGWTLRLVILNCITEIYEQHSLTRVGL